MNAKIGIIGGSGLDDPTLFESIRDVEMDTPWGAPSSSLREGVIGGVPVVLMARHGRNHTIPPTQVNYRANIWALKSAGCTHVLASTAVGSLREEIRRGDLIVPDQFIDFTRSRPLSFFESFEPGAPAHTALSDPFDAGLRAALIDGLSALGYSFHDKGTVITIEGPRFSTRAESRMFRIWGADIINMSIATEAIKLIFEYLPRAYKLGAHDAEARERMANASCMAGMAFANAFLGVCHSMAHKLGSYHHLPHGIANALMIDEVIRFNSAENPVKMGTFPQYKYPECMRRYAAVADVLNLGGKNDAEKVENLIKAIDKLKAEIEIKPTIKEYGVDEKDFLDRLDQMSEDAFDDQCTGANPRYPLISEIKDMYLRAYYGK